MEHKSYVAQQTMCILKPKLWSVILLYVGCYFVLSNYGILILNHSENTL